MIRDINYFIQKIQEKELSKLSEEPEVEEEEKGE